MSRFQISVDAQILCDKILEYKDRPGDIITYAELSQIIGRDVQREARSLLTTARRRVMADHNILVDVVPGVGIITLDESQKARTWRSSAERVRRETGRAIRRLATVDYARLSREDQTEVLTGQSFAGAIAQAASAKQIKRIEARVQEGSRKLPSAVALGLTEE